MTEGDRMERFAEAVPRVPEPTTGLAGILYKVPILGSFMKSIRRIFRSRDRRVVLREMAIMGFTNFRLLSFLFTPLFMGAMFYIVAFGIDPMLFSTVGEVWAAEGFGAVSVIDLLLILAAGLTAVIALSETLDLLWVAEGTLAHARGSRSPLANSNLSGMHGTSGKNVFTPKT